MVAAVKQSGKLRWECTIGGAESFADDLGLIGSWVGPRRGPNKRTQGQREDYVLRRILVAWKEAQRLRFPVSVRPGGRMAQEPDFVFTWKPDETLGLEITEATEANYQAWLTTTEASSEPGEAVLLPDDLGPDLDRTAYEFYQAIARKVSKFDEGAYRATGDCDLAVYDNSAWGWNSERGRLLGRLGYPVNLLGRFRQIHFVFGEKIILDAFGNGRREIDVSGTYEIDYARWVSEQINHLRQNDLVKIDREHLIEELEDLGRSERNALGAHLKNLMVHLLKWQFQPHMRSESWRLSMLNARSEIEEKLTEMPSLKSYLGDEIDRQYKRARRAAAVETGLREGIFPDECPYSAVQLVDDEYLPDADANE